MQNLTHELSEKQQRHEKELAIKGELEDQLQKTIHATADKDALEKEYQEHLKKEELRKRDVERELKKVKDERFKKQKEFHDFIEKEKSLCADIAGADSAVKNLSSKANELELQIAQKKELRYNQDFNIQLMQRKVRRASVSGCAISVLTVLG